MDYGYPQAPVMQQPQQGNTVVTMQPPSAVFGQGGPRPWASGICDCCSDMQICCLGCWCTCCLACKVSSDMNEFLCLPLVLPTYQTALRVKLRTQENIEGTVFNDCLMEQCCNVCSLCQLAREVKAVKQRQAGNIQMSRT